MSINSTTKTKSNKHSGGETKELVERPIRRFNYSVEPDELLNNSCMVSYQITIAKWLTNFNGALFNINYPFLEANTDLTKDQLLVQLNRKLGVNLEALVSYLNGDKQSIYKNLDDFKAVHTFTIEECSLMFDDWLEVEFKRDCNSKHYPYHEIWFTLDSFKLSDYTSRCMFNLAVPYIEYVQSIVPSHSVLRFIKQIQYASTEKYELEYRRFKLQDISKHYYHANAKSISDKSVSVTIKFDIDLYFSHIKYLYKVFQTYN